MTMPGVRSERARRPSYLFSSLIKCGCCGGGFSKISRDHYGCSNARNRGTCDNLLTIRRDVLEASVLSGLRTHLLQPELMQEFAAEYHRELNRLNAERDRGRVHKQEELAKVTRQIRAIIEAIKDGHPHARHEGRAAGAGSAARRSWRQRSPRRPPRPRRCIRRWRSSTARRSPTCTRS